MVAQNVSVGYLPHSFSMAAYSSSVVGLPPAMMLLKSCDVRVPSMVMRVPLTLVRVCSREARLVMVVARIAVTASPSDWMAFRLSCSSYRHRVVLANYSTGLKDCGYGGFCG